MTENEFSAKNDEERNNLVVFARGLSAGELSHSMPAGWTVSALLGHLAFWDLRALILLEKWQGEVVAASPIDTDVVNEATRGLCLAIEGQAAVELVCSAAEAIDQAIAKLSPETIKTIQATPAAGLRLDRGAHRRTHIAEIQQALAKR